MLDSLFRSLRRFFQRRSLGVTALTMVAFLGVQRAGAFVGVQPAGATDQVYFSANTNVTNILIGYINAETVRLDISSWYLSEHSISIAIANRFAAGVPVRIIGDRGAIFEADPHTKTEFYYLANLGVPIRLRFNPTNFPEINHWKAAIFVGQNVVEFGSGNFAPTELAPESPTNFCDESELFTSDPQLVNAFKTKFDVMWNDTTVEPESIAGGPPYLKDWDDACLHEPTGNCADYATQDPNPKPMVIDTTRREPDNPTPPDLIWGQGPDFNDRLIQEINNEHSKVDVVVYRLEVANLADAILAKFQAGVPVRLIIDPDQYTNILWPEFWLTHANLDRLWAAGVPMRMRTHAGVTHMKTLITSSYATNASSNFGPNWQRDHDYFVPAATKPAIYQAFVDRFNQMWADSTNFGPMVTTRPNAPDIASPAPGAAGVAVSSSLIWNRAAWATSYDVYFGTSSANLTLVANVAAQLVQDPPATYGWKPSSSLQGNTTYSWKVVARTFATPVNAAIMNSTSIQSFSTGSASSQTTLPGPWQSTDIGAVGIDGSSSFDNGQFTISGAGSDIWGSDDSFQFAYQTLAGDGEIIARVTGAQNTSSNAKAGVMFRGEATSNAAHVILDVEPGGSIEFMTRSSNGGSTSWLAGSTHAMPVWLRLARAGSTVTGYTSSDGTNWATAGSTTITLPTSALVGMAVTSHNTSQLNTSTYDQVSVTTGGTPPPPPPPPPPGLPSPWQSQDIGAVGTAGSSSFSNGQFTVSGAGGDIWGPADAFQFAYQSIGDGEIVARVTGVQNTNTHAKAGLMFRNSLTAGSAHVILDVQPTGDIEFMSRSATGGATSWLAGTTHTAPVWLKLTRSGSTISGFVSSDGSTWTMVGSTSVTLAATANAGLLASSHDTAQLNTSTFTQVTVTTGSTPPPPPPPPPPTATNVVIYSSDLPSNARHGSWTPVSSSTSPQGIELGTTDTGVANTSTPLVSPTDYVDVTFNANANTPYTLWLRVSALSNSKFNDSLWVQFSDALVNGSGIYPMNSTSGLLVNLANDSSGASINGWGWVNGAYWLSQATTVTFANDGSHTLRIQVREDGVAFDQIVLSPNTYLNAPPGPVSNDATIVAKP